jgi:hypothetical protein
MNIPAPITAFGGFLALASLAFGLFYALNPGKTIPYLHAQIPADRLAVWLVGVRSVSQAALMLVALLSGNTRFLQGAFIMRIVNEVGDETAMITSGKFRLLIFLYFVLLIIGEASCIWALGW